MAKVTGSLVTYPARATFLWFAGLIVVGTVLLSLPIAQASPAQPISLLDAWFTATSAACVTGLGVRSTCDDFSGFGQGVILGLFQLGGLGIMTVTTFLTLRLGGRESMRQRAVIATTLGGSDYDLRWVLRSVIAFVLLAEGLGFALLAGRNLVWNDAPWGDSLWEAFFHSVSAFCNAGFSLHNDSLSRYQHDPFVNGTIMTLIVLGGLGYPVVLDLQRHSGQGSWRDRWDRLTLHTKMMVIGTASLLIGGTLGILLLEWNNGLRDLPLGTKFLVASFQSVAPRTAGFQTINLNVFHEATLFLIVLLMLIGAGPCSTAGGFKVSTLMVLVWNAWIRLTGHHRVSLFRRTISDEVIERATATALVFTVIAVFGVTSLLMIEPASVQRFLPSVFEVASALGTVGLSVDTSQADQFTYTSSLHASGKLVMIGLMFLGRLGPITVFIALARAERKDRVEYPKEEVLIG